MRRPARHTLSHHMSAACGTAAHVIPVLAGRVLAMSAYEQGLPGRGTEGVATPVRATRRLRCAENTSVIFAQTIAQGQTLDHRGRTRQTPRSGFVGHIGMVGAVPCPEPETAQGATHLSPPASPPSELPGQDKRHSLPVRTARRSDQEDCAVSMAAAQFTAPGATLAQQGRGRQTRCSGIVFGVGSAGLNQNAQRRQHQSANAQETRDQQPDHPAQLHGLALGDVGNPIGKLRLKIGNLHPNSHALLVDLRLKRVLHAVDFLINGPDLGLKRVLHQIDLLIQRRNRGVDLRIQRRNRGVDLPVQRRNRAVDLRIQRLHILVNKLDLASQTFLDPFKVALGRRSFGVMGTYEAGDGFGLRLFKPRVLKTLGFRDGIVGRVCHDHSLAGVPFSINPLRALCQCLRVSAATLAATLCLAQAAQAQTSLQSPAFNPPPAAGTSEALLDGFERRLMQTSGQLITLNLSGTSEYGVFYAPFSILWLLDGTTGAVRGAGRVTRTRDHLYLTRDEITLLAGPEMPAPIDAHAPGTDAPQHPIASFHDRLLSQPLAEPLADLPAGSRFETEASGEPGGTVTLPGAGDTEAIPARALWRSLGDHIVITRGDGRSETLHWRAVDAALKGKAQFPNRMRGLSIALARHARGEALSSSRR